MPPPPPPPPTSSSPGNAPCPGRSDTPRSRGTRSPLSICGRPQYRSTSQENSPNPGVGTECWSKESSSRDSCWWTGCHNWSGRSEDHSVPEKKRHYRSWRRRTGEGVGDHGGMTVAWTVGLRIWYPPWVVAPGYGVYLRSVCCCFWCGGGWLHAILVFPIFLGLFCRAMDSFTTEFWACFLHDNTSPKPFLVGLTVDILGRGLGPVGCTHIHTSLYGSDWCPHLSLAPLGRLLVGCVCLESCDAFAFVHAMFLRQNPAGLLL